MTRILLCLAALSAVAPLSVGCKQKPDSTKEWPAQSDAKQLIEILKSTRPTGDLDARIMAANQLGTMGPAAKDALPHLQKLTKDKNPNLAKAAQDAITKINAP